MKAPHWKDGESKNAFRYAGFFVLFLIFLLAYTEGGSLGAEPIKVGLLLPDSKNSSSLGNPYLRGAEMAVSEVNAREGKQGTQLLLVLRRGQFIGEKDLKVLEESLWEDRIRFLIGTVSTEAILPTARVAYEKGVPFLVFPNNFLTAVSTGEEPPNLFWISPAPEAFQRAAVRTVAQLGPKRYFLLAQNSNIGRIWVKYFGEELRKLKPDALQAGGVFLPEKVDDYTPYIQDVISAKAEICVSHLGTDGWTRFARVAKKQGYFKKVVHFELESGNLEALVNLGKKAPMGVWGITAFPFWGVTWKETQDFVSKYFQKNNSYPGLDALSGYVSVYAIIEAIKKARSLEYEKLMASLEDLTFRTPVGLLSFRKADHRALWPIWCGVSKFNSNYPFVTLEDLKAFGPDSFAP